MKILGKVIQSKSDKRAFRAIQLKNKLQCLIISDSDAQTSSAALSVGVGSLKDPLQAQGLAHYLEHMLFMGTEKYPNENDYSNFIAKNSGHSNAYTSQQQTNFHFQVATNAFSQTLDRFAQFFIAPLMSDSSSQRQLNAVHSEHSKNLQNDMWKKYQLTKHLAKKSHPYSKFSTGDKNSLANPNLRKMLHDFYAENYSSNLMKMVVYGKQDLDKLSETVQNKFSAIPNKNYQRLKIDDIPYEKQTFKNMYKITPVKDRKVLELYWILSNQQQFYQNHPGMYLSHLLGHEGKGSLLSFLISEGLATSLSASYDDAFSCFSEFEVSVSLTKKGVQNINVIIEYIMYYLQMLKQKGPQQWVFRQIQKLNQVKFDFMQKHQGMSFVSKMAKRLQKRSAQEVIVYPYFMKEWKPMIITNFLNELRYDNLMVLSQAKQFENECKDTEPIYKTKYTKQTIQSLNIKKCLVDIPMKNIFLPENLEILPQGKSQIPDKIYNSDKMQVFWKQDHRFNMPKMTVSLSINYNGSNTVRDQLCSSFYISMMNQKLRQFVYLAQTAGINASISIGNYFTFQISVSGFRSSIEKFIIPYLTQILQFNPEDEQYFKTEKEKKQRIFSNYFLNDPYQLAYNSIFMALREGSSIPPQQKLQYIPHITLEEVKTFAKQWKSKIFIESLINGNIEKQSALNLSEKIQGLFSSFGSLQKSLIPTIRPIKLPSNKTWGVQQKLKSQQQENSAIIVHYQYEASDLRLSVLQDLSLSFVKQPAFDYLRTKEQLGYIVMCLPDDHRGVLGLSILVQSQIKSSYELVEYVDTFVNKILKQKINELDQKTFGDYKNSLKTIKEEKDKNLGSESSRFWREIKKHKYEFLRNEKELQILEKITLQDLKSFLNFLFHLNPRRFEMHIISSKQEEKNIKLRKERLKKIEDFTIFDSVEVFKKRMSLYPDFYSHI